MGKTKIVFEEQRELEKQREEIIEKWEKLGFLDGLVGNINPDIAKLYECCESSLLSAKTKD